MSTGYRVINSDRNNFYQVIEKDELIIDEYHGKKKANAICRALNLGKGFAGDTPNFFAIGYFANNLTN